MVTRIFALIIGIDSYKSGTIWNLLSCVEDAKRIKHWLVNDLNVPRDQIRLLLDSQASKEGIENNFMEHFTNNAAIEPGDAMLLYFAGHGSVITAPVDWFHTGPATGNAEVLCPYDHDTKQGAGRIAGISDRSLDAMIYELSKVKGNNITFIADCCFSPIQSRENIRDRSRTRWTPTVKAIADDLFRGLWTGARGQPHTSRLGISGLRPSTHTFLAACGSGDKAVEGKDGGRFTTHFLRAASTLALHRTSYSQIVDHISYNEAGNHPKPICKGQLKDGIVFNGVPFVPDARYFPVRLEHDKQLRVEIGAIHGVVEGSELSLHLHNFRCSRNTTLCLVVVSDVHPTWCHVQSSSPSKHPRVCWAQVIRWNSRRPFRVNLKSTCTSLIKAWKLRRSMSTKVEPSSRQGLNILRVRHAAEADISVKFGSRQVIVERHDDLIVSNCRRIVKIEQSNALDVVDDAARFHLHLHRRNPENPLKDLVHMELYRLDLTSWETSSPNLLRDGKAVISYQRGDIFSVNIQNRSEYDLWPYLAYMDPNCYGITMLSHPDSSSKLPPLPKHSSFEIGSGMPGSEALSFALADHDHLDSGFLKLFLSQSPVSMGSIEQGPTFNWNIFTDQDVPSQAGEVGLIWDTDIACVTFLRHQ